MTAGDRDPGAHDYDADKSVFRAEAFRRESHAGSFAATAEGTLETGLHAYQADRL